MSVPVPKYCPNCGAQLKDVQAIEDPRTGALGYDVYCDECGWSGEIWPDEKLQLAKPV